MSTLEREHREATEVHRRKRARLRGGALILGALLLLAGRSPAQECPRVQDQEELRTIPEITTRGPELSTTFDVQSKPLCVPTAKIETEVKHGRTITTYKAEKIDLRTYVYPDPKTGKPTWGFLSPAGERWVFPGPTLRLRRATEKAPGQGLAILLKNGLKGWDKECNSACLEKISCDSLCSPADLEELKKKCVSATPPSNCCCVINCTQKPPNCFHGDNATNLHFHGSHSSPQEPQDFVGLELRPFRKDGPLPDPQEHGSHGPYSKIVYGEFQYRVAPFGREQPEGTHWYHPHNHGSVALQVANGLAGALLIEGPFDDWLREFYRNDLPERLMVLQQIAPSPNLFKKQGGAPPQTLVNGQINPKITFKPGEVQRWRIVNATMSSGTLLEIKFPEKLVFRQIALDGVRFSPVNYECQPLFNFNPAKPPSSFPCAQPTGQPTLSIAPGNRADFLVQAPLVETPQEGLRIERRLIELPGEEGGQRLLLRQRDEADAPGPSEPALFTVVVDDGIPGNEDQAKAPAAPSQLPDRLPDMPKFLSNITNGEVAGNDVKLSFQQAVVGTSLPWPYRGNPVTEFRISGRQFAPDCVNVTTSVGTAAEWTIANETQITHPFHIHTNPFQLMSYKGVPVQPPGQTKPEPIWMDTLPLPLATVVPAKAPKDLTTPVKVTPASTTIRQRYEDFTGAYVLHCHFLGHEDRGMMFAVQTVCKDKPDKYGKAGQQVPECAGELLPAVKACS